MAIWKISGLALTAAVGSSLLIGQASAMPADGLATAASQVAEGVQDAAYVCGPYRCWWRPGPYWGPGCYGPGYYGPRPYWGYGWHRRWW